MEQNIVQQGYMQKWTTEADKKKSSWQPMYFVLHGTSRHNAARLDWYDTKDQFLTNPGTRKALFLEEIRNCDHLTLKPEEKSLYGPSAKYLLVISTYRSNISDYVLMCDTEDMLKEWLDHLKTLLKDVFAMSNTMRKTILEKSPGSEVLYHPQITGGTIGTLRRNEAETASSFDVTIDDTAAAIHCELQGSYRLLLSQQHITLVDPDTSNPVITWMYQHIRRFGFSERSLTIEGGSKCGIGKGLFIFKTSQGNDLMAAINERMKVCASQEHDEYSYISFAGATPKPTEKDTAKPSELEYEGIPVYGKIENKGTVKTKASTEKPSPSDKPSPAAADDDKPRTNVPSHLQPKMSEVLSQMPSQSSTTQQAEEDVYGYNHLNLHMTTSKGNTMAKQEEENPYGEQLIQKLKNSSEKEKNCLM